MPAKKQSKRAVHSSKKSAQKKPKALLFDFGGTLAFLDYDLLAREFSRDGRPIDALKLEHAEYEGRAAIDRLLMSGGDDVITAYTQYFGTWMAAAGIPEEELPTYGEHFRRLHGEASLWRIVRPGTMEALERLKSAGFRLAIVSNAEGQIDSDARRYGLHPFFDVIIDSHVVGVAKPDPRIFHIALERLGVAPDEARFAGDIYSIDILGARAAGIEAALIDQHDRYSWIDHAKIRHMSELHPLDKK
jgi:putative hydrolase of the HAD superfamily